MQDRDTQGGGRKPITKHKAALGRVAKALEARQDFNTVKGYETLPEKARKALESMEPDELQALLRSFKRLEEAGLYEDVEDEHGGARVSFF